MTPSSESRLRRAFLLDDLEDVAIGSAEDEPLEGRCPFRVDQRSPM